MFLVIFLCNCNQTKRQTVNEPTVNVDTLFEKEIPVLTFNNKALQRELDSIVEKEINCYYYKKDTTCFG